MRKILPEPRLLKKCGRELFNIFVGYMRLSVGIIISKTSFLLTVLSLFYLTDDLHSSRVRWLTCLVSGLGVRCHNYECTPAPKQSQQSTSEPSPQEVLRYSSEGLHSRRLNGKIKGILKWQNNIRTCSKPIAVCVMFSYPLHTPLPYTGDGVSQKSRTCWPRRGSQRRSGCPAPRTPAGSGSAGAGFVCWSSSWQSAAASLCVWPNTQLYDPNERERSIFTQ